MQATKSQSNAARETTKFQDKVLSAYERHERSCSVFNAAGWVKTSDPSYRWTKGTKQIRCATHGWVLIESDDLSSVRPSDIRKGKFVLAHTNGDPEELLTNAARETVQTKFQKGQLVGVTGKDRFDFNRLGEIVECLSGGYYKVWIETHNDCQTIHERNLEII